MRVARHLPATPTTPRQSAYFQELEPFNSKPHPGWMHLFRHTSARGNTSDCKVTRRSHSTFARPQGVLDLMENSWFGPDAATASPQDSNLSVHDSADSFGGAHRHQYRKLHSQGGQPSHAHPRQAAGAHPSYSSPTGTVQGARQQTAATHTAQITHQATEPQSFTDAGQQDAKLGTWAHRQIRFPWPRKTAELFDSAGSRNGTATTDMGSPSAVSTPTKIPKAPSTPSPLPPPNMQKPPPSPRQPSTDLPSKPSSAGDEDTKLVEAAWRWRFGRRWVQEQAKQFDPDFQNEDAEEEWDDALGYLDACGPGFNLIARTSSEFGENHAKNHSLVSQDSGVSKSLNSLLLDEGSFSQHESALREAAKQEDKQGVVAIAKKAHDLYKQQQEIQKRADQRWEGAAQQGTAWLGQALDPVRIDVLGKFTFALVKVENRQGSSRLLVRGRPGCSQAALVQDVENEMANKMATKKLPKATITLVGSGIMQWSKDKQIDVIQGTLAVGGGNIRSNADVAHVAGSLIRSALPMHYHITVNGGRI
ncbi:hypothetical protein ABBQ32_002520 [Trebouxia sp. C0010 RCD-2024]